MPEEIKNVIFNSSISRVCVAFVILILDFIHQSIQNLSFHFQCFNYYGFYQRFAIHGKGGYTKTKERERKWLKCAEKQTAKSEIRKCFIFIVQNSNESERLLITCYHHCGTYQIWLRIFCCKLKVKSPNKCISKSMVR